MSNKITLDQIMPNKIVLLFVNKYALIHLTSFFFRFLDTYNYSQSWKSEAKKIKKEKRFFKNDKYYYRKIG